MAAQQQHVGLHQQISFCEQIESTIIIFEFFVAKGHTTWNLTGLHAIHSWQDQNYRGTANTQNVRIEVAMLLLHRVPDHIAIVNLGHGAQEHELQSRAPLQSSITLCCSRCRHANICCKHFIPGMCFHFLLHSVYSKALLHANLSTSQCSKSTGH